MAGVSLASLRSPTRALKAGQGSLGHFPLLPSMKQFRSSLGDALEGDPHIQQADVPLGRKILTLAASVDLWRISTASEAFVW